MNKGFTSKSGLVGWDFRIVKRRVTSLIMSRSVVQIHSNLEISL